MIIQILLFALGFVLVLKGGDLFVDSSTVIAFRLNIPRIIIGGTIASFATTAIKIIDLTWKK